MKRTTVQIDQALYMDLQQLAEQKGKTPTRVIREALAEYVVANKEVSKLPSFAALGASGYTDTAERAEELLAEGIGNDGWAD